MSRHHHHHRHHSNYQASNALTLMILGAFIGSPLIFWFIFFQFTAAPTIAIATLATTGSALFSFGISALILYASIGATYLCSAAHECYKTDKGPLDILKSLLIHQEGLSVNGVLNSIGAALWSPFIVLGGLSGMAVKAIVSAFIHSISELSQTTNKSFFCEKGDEYNPTSTPDLHYQEKNINLQKSRDSFLYHKDTRRGSYSTLMPCLGIMDNPQPNKTHQRSSSAPIYTSHYADIKPSSAERKQEPPILSCR